MNFRKKAFLIVVLFYICYVLFPLFGDLLRVSPVVASGITCLGCMVLFPRAMFNKTMIWCGIYLFLLFIYLIFDRPVTVGIGIISDASKFVVESAFILPSIMIFSVLIYLNDSKIYKYVSYFSITLVVVTLLYLVPLLMENRTILRIDDSGENDSFGIVGLPLYTLMHGYLLMLPAMLYNYRVALSGRKIMAIVLLMAFCYLIYASYITTSLILAVICVLFALIYNSKKKMVTVAVLLLLLTGVWIMYATGFAVQMLERLIVFYDGTFVADKLMDLQDSLMTKDVRGSSILGRVEYHDISERSFLSNPILGNGVVGGHSSLMDRLGGMGLVVFIPFIGLIISVLRRFYSLMMYEDSKAYYLLSAFVIFVILYNKGLFGKEGWLIAAVVIPACFISFQNYKKGNA